MWRAVRSLLLVASFMAPVQAQEASSEDIRKLDDQVQDIKTEILGIAAEFERLEKQLLYPSETRLTVTLAIESLNGIRLGAAKIRVDGELVAHHVYSDGEENALRRGGVQNLYLGNVSIGQHELHVSISGELPDGTSFEEQLRHEFDKGVAARGLHITLVEAGREHGRIRITSR